MCTRADPSDRHLIIRQIQEARTAFGVASYAALAGVARALRAHVMRAHPFRPLPSAVPHRLCA